MEDNQIVTAEGNSTELVATPDPESMAFVLPADMPDLEAAEVGMSIEQKYYEFTQAGQSVRAVFNGFKSIISKKDGERKEIPAIVFQNREGVFLNSGASLVGQFRNIPV